jgi:hypothetical protein
MIKNLIIKVISPNPADVETIRRIRYHLETLQRKACKALKLPFIEQAAGI